MFRNPLHLLAVLCTLVGLLTTSASAGGFTHLLCVSEPCLPNCVGKYCCDDYCSKCAPQVCPKLCFQCDDYCRKPIPCARPIKCFGCDDYCGKPFQLCCPPKCDFKCYPHLGRARTIKHDH